MVVGSDEWNAKERKGCEILGERQGRRLESRAGRRPLSARFFSVPLCRVGLGVLFSALSFALAPVRPPGVKKSLGPF
jgi:hypothetical protein